MANERVVDLLQSHRIRISRAWARQVRSVVPRYREIDQIALERNLANLLAGLERLLRTGKERALLDAVAGVTQMRLAAGFVVPDLLVATVCFLSVARRFLIEKSASAVEGLDDFEALEAICLPLMGKVATVFLESTNDAVPGGYDLSRFQQLLSGESGPFQRVKFERVTGDDDEEVTDPSLPPIV